MCNNTSKEQRRRSTRMLPSIQTVFIFMIISAVLIIVYTELTTTTIETKKTKVMILVVEMSINAYIFCGLFIYLFYFFKSM